MLGSEQYAVYRTVIKHVLSDSERLPSLPTITLKIRKAVGESNTTAASLARLATLLEKYDVPVPRYTSYPTVPQWHDAPSTSQWIASLARAADRPDKALAVFEVDSLGLDKVDRAILDAVVNRFSGGPVGLSTLAIAVGEERGAELGERTHPPYPRRPRLSPSPIG